MDYDVIYDMFSVVQIFIRGYCFYCLVKPFMLSGVTLDGMRSDSSLSHEAARLELVSSVNALNYFADKYVSEDYQALFDKLMNKEDNARNIFDSLQNLLVNYAAGGSKNSMMLSILNANNSGSIENMFRYWSVML